MDSDETRDNEGLCVPAVIEILARTNFDLLEQIRVVAWVSHPEKRSSNIGRMRILGRIHPYREYYGGGEKPYNNNCLCFKAELHGKQLIGDNLGSRCATIIWIYICKKHRKRNLRYKNAEIEILDE